MIWWELKRKDLKTKGNTPKREREKEKKDEGFFASESYVIPDCIKS